MYGCIAWCSCVTPNSVSGYVSDSFACTWDPFPPTGLHHPYLIWGFWLSLVNCYAMFGSYPLEACSFPKWNRGEGVDLGEGEGEKRTHLCLFRCLVIIVLVEWNWAQLLPSLIHSIQRAVAASLGTSSYVTQTSGPPIKYLSSPFIMHILGKKNRYRDRQCTSLSWTDIYLLQEV